MAIRKAAKKVGVPYENLRARMRGDVPMLVYIPAGATIGFLEIIEYCAARGFCIEMAELRFLIRQAALVSSQRPVTDTFPDRCSVQHWVKKNSDQVSFRYFPICGPKSRPFLS